MHATRGPVLSFSTVERDCFLSRDQGVPSPPTPPPPPSSPPAPPLRPPPRPPFAPAPHSAPQNLAAPARAGPGPLASHRTRSLSRPAPPRPALTRVGCVGRQQGHTGAQTQTSARRPAVPCARPSGPGHDSRASPSEVRISERLGDAGWPASPSAGLPALHFLHFLSRPTVTDRILTCLLRV